MRLSEVLSMVKYDGWELGFKAGLKEARRKMRSYAMPVIGKLDNAAWDRAQAQRRMLIDKLLDDDWERWDMYPNGDERFRKGERFVTVWWNAEASQFETSS